MKFALALLVLGIVTFGVYSFTSKPDFESTFDAQEDNLHAKLQSAKVYPTTAYTNSTLQIKISRGTKEEYKYMSVKWFRNDGEIPGAAGSSLAARFFKKGDQIHAEVNVLGPEALDEPVVTIPVTVLNSPPRIITASTALRSMDSDILITRVNATDPDKDPLRYSYKWFRNGSQIPGVNQATLPVASFANDDDLYAEIVASDGDIESMTYKCDPVTLGSNAPAIVSQPPSSFTPDRRYVYQLEVQGPDMETLIFELTKAPEGMTISSTGYIDWELPPAALGKRDYEVVVHVADETSGESFQTFTIGLSGSN